MVLYQATTLSPSNINMSSIPPQHVHSRPCARASVTIKTLDRAALAGPGGPGRPGRICHDERRHKSWNQVQCETGSLLRQSSASALLSKWGKSSTSLVVSFLLFSIFSPHFVGTVHPSRRLHSKDSKGDYHEKMYQSISIRRHPLNGGFRKSTGICRCYDTRSCTRGGTGAARTFRPAFPEASIPTPGKGA